MNSFDDGRGAEIGMYITCQGCGKHLFLRQIGYNSVDAALKNRHSFYDVFETVPQDWKIKCDLGWVCPQCAKDYELMIEDFKKRFI